MSETKQKSKNKPIAITLVPGTLVSDKIIAAALSISRSHLWGNLVKNGKLNPVKLSQRTTRFRTDEAIALIAAA